MIPHNVEQWLQSDTFPQRVLLSAGDGSGFDIALHIAATLQGADIATIQSGAHPDTIVFQDTGKSFKIDFSDAAKKDGQDEHENVRGLIRWAHRTPQPGHYRIAILQNLQRVSRESPHALLKLIEEPPSRTIFLFTCKNHHSLLPTILSRMTVVQVSADATSFTPDSDLVSFLQTDNLIAQFRYLDDLAKAAKDNRNLWKELSESLLQHARNMPDFQPHLELFYDTHEALMANVNPRFTLERLALKLSQAKT